MSVQKWTPLAASRPLRRHCTPAMKPKMPSHSRYLAFSTLAMDGHACCSSRLSYAAILILSWHRRFKNPSPSRSASGEDAAIEDDIDHHNGDTDQSHGH